MLNSRLKTLVGQKVMVNFKGLAVVAKLVGLKPEFQGRDCIVHFPTEKRPRKVWASKITPLTK